MTKGEATLFGVIVLVLITPVVVCVGVTAKYTPTTTNTSALLPACTMCDVCRSDDEDLARSKAAYDEGVSHGQYGGFESYVVELCDGTPGCFAAFAEMRAKYEDLRTTERE